MCRTQPGTHRHPSFDLMRQAIIVWPVQGLSGAVAGQNLGTVHAHGCGADGERHASCPGGPALRVGREAISRISRMAGSSRLLIALKRATGRVHLLVRREPGLEALGRCWRSGSSCGEPPLSPPSRSRSPELSRQWQFPTCGRAGRRFPILKSSRSARVGKAADHLGASDEGTRLRLLEW